MGYSDHNQVRDHVGAKSRAEFALGHFVWVQPADGSKAANTVTRIETGYETARLLAAELSDLHRRQVQRVRGGGGVEAVGGTKTLARL